MGIKFTIEMAPFTLASGVSDAALLAASERLEREFLSQQKGYVGRALTRRPDGGWADVVMWESKESAEAIIPLVPQSPAAGAYFACMASADTDNPSQGISLMQAQGVYGALAELRALDRAH